MNRSFFDALIAMMTAVVVISLAGCDENERLAQMASEAADRQAAQNEEMVRLNREVAEGTKHLVEANAETHQELAELQRDLQAEQAEVGNQRDLLESDRKEIATQRQRDPIIAEAIKGIGLLLGCLLPLLLCWYLLRSLREENDDSVIAEVLIEELASYHPTLLPPFPNNAASIEHEKPSRPVLTAEDDLDEGPVE